jgi:hypothetical protein
MFKSIPIQVTNGLELYYDEFTYSNKLAQLYKSDCIHNGLIKKHFMHILIQSGILDSQTLKNF